MPALGPTAGARRLEAWFPRNQARSWAMAASVPCAAVRRNPPTRAWRCKTAGRREARAVRAAQQTRTRKISLNNVGKHAELRCFATHLLLPPPTRPQLPLSTCRTAAAAARAITEAAAAVSVHLQRVQWVEAAAEPRLCTPQQIGRTMLCRTPPPTLALRCQALSSSAPAQRRLRRRRQTR